jgi:hypothetical protein
MCDYSLHNVASRPAQIEDRLVTTVTSAFEAPAVVSGLDDIAVVGQAIEQRGRHLGITEDARPFTEGEVGGDDD